MFGLDETEVRSAVAAARPDQGADGLESAEVAEAFASAAWTGIAEPGDGTAGVLVAALGAAAALHAVVTGRDAAALAAEVGEVLADPQSVPVLRAGLERWKPRLVAADALRFLTSAALCRVQLLVPSDEQWPDGMADLGEHAPLALWTRGNADLLRHERSIALVGARAATGYGETVAAESAAGLADRDFTVVSGAAYGIDGMAHRAALASGGATIAFLAGGADRFYPSGHSALLQRIVGTGLVVAELPCGFTPTKWRFLQRNRLIAAASSATVVVEAGTRSGSLNTAGHAASLGRPLGAVPGPVTSPASAGCHRLLREFDAVCVTTAEEMAELVLGPSEGVLNAVPADRTPEQRRVLDALNSRPRSVLEIAKQSGLATGMVQSVLGLLELEGAVAESALGWRVVQ
jgi:DNA processing protein